MYNGWAIAYSIRACISYSACVGGAALVSLRVQDGASLF